MVSGSCRYLKSWSWVLFYCKIIKLPTKIIIVNYRLSYADAGPTTTHFVAPRVPSTDILHWGAPPAYLWEKNEDSRLWDSKFKSSLFSPMEKLVSVLLRWNEIVPLFFFQFYHLAVIFHFMIYQLNNYQTQQHKNYGRKKSDMF